MVFYNLLCSRTVVAEVEQQVKAATAANLKVKQTIDEGRAKLNQLKFERQQLNEQITAVKKSGD